jgi:hypothetical protein
MIEEYRYALLTTFYGLPTVDFAFAHAEDLVPGSVPTDVEARAWRVGSDDFDGPGGDEIFPLFLESVDTTRVRALLLGCWSGECPGEEAGKSVAALLEAVNRFPALEALFVSDISSEQSEVSWIEQVDPGPLLAAFPRLRVLGVRGSQGLTVEPFTHDRLEELTFQTGGLPPAVVRAVGECKLPALTGLDLYLGTGTYGGGATGDDLAGVLSGVGFPALRHLGLRNVEDTDTIAEAVAEAPVVAQLESLDLSLGMLGDEGAEVLLAGQPLSHLKRLDLHHHFLSQTMIERLHAALPGVDVNVDEQLRPRDPWRPGDEPQRYIAVTE